MNRAVRSRLRIATLIALMVVGVGVLVVRQRHFKPQDSPPIAAEISADFAPAPEHEKSELVVEAPSEDSTQTALRGAIDRELLVRFGDAASMRSFLDQVFGVGGRVLGIIPNQNTVRLGFEEAAQGEKIRALLPASARVDFNYVVAPPSPRDPKKTDNGGPYVAFDDRALAWLGVPAANGNWGTGIKVAVLDTGMLEVAALAHTRVTKIDLIGQAEAGDAEQLHGTAVASIIAGSLPDARGVAPSAELLSIRVLDASGTGDTFTVAQGILAAVDNGARIINLSLGSAGDSFVMRDAVDYAAARGVAIVAAVGNEGLNTVDYPAAYPGVIGVTAVDANGQRAQFANYGPGVALAAPGLGVQVPWSAQQVLVINGTSAAAPFVSGALAGILSQNPGLSSAEAVALLLRYANDAGPPGPDPFFGAGILSVDRILNRNQPGIRDAAVADIYYDPDAATGTSPLMVTVQNRGTTPLLNLRVNVQVAQRPSVFYINILGAGEVKGEWIPLPPGFKAEAVTAQVFSGGVADAKPGNDVKTVLIRAQSTRPPSVSLP